jgi:hypothetical protein
MHLKMNFEHTDLLVSLFCRVVDPDPDPDWIRIQRLVWIRIRIGNPDPDPDPGARKLRNFSGKNALFNYFFKKILPLKRYNYFLKKILMNNTSIFDLI